MKDDRDIWYVRSSDSHFRAIANVCVFAYFGLPGILLLEKGYSVFGGVLSGVAIYASFIAVKSIISYRKERRIWRELEARDKPAPSIAA